MDFLGEKDHLLTYRVLWSEPTRRKPVPVATASVYFYLLPSSEVREVSVGIHVYKGHLSPQPNAHIPHRRSLTS